MKLINQTVQRQQILLIDGSSINVLPGMSVEIEKNEVYASELKRITNLFKVDDTKRQTRNRPTIEKEESKPKEVKEEKINDEKFDEEIKFGGTN